MRGPGCRTGRALLACLLLGSAPALPGAAQPPGAPKEAPREAAAPPLVEAFQKGPIGLWAQVTRIQGHDEPVTLPLFQVPVLRFKDRLDLAFSGEAFDTRVTDAEWSLIVVFLPRTIAPTEQGVVDFRMKRKDERMVVPPITVPYDSIPMIFLIPEKNARKKVLKDLNEHLQAFRTLCGKIADISTERAAADQFIHELESIDKNLSAVQYDNALSGFLHLYGDNVSADLQAGLNTSTSNLEKCQILTQQFRNTNVLVTPPTTTSTTITTDVSSGTERPASAYVSIFFDLAAIINNLWPGHQFRYLPAVARNFHNADVDLYYSDWIHTTGNLRGALMCCPGKWEDQAPPSCEFALAPGAALLDRQTLLKVLPAEKERNPFTLFGHDWKLLLTDPGGASLPPLPLAVIPQQKAFAAFPGPLLEPLRRLGAGRLKARVVGRWGFSSVAMAPVELPAGCDPAWTPPAAAVAAFQIGRECAIPFPAEWAGCVARVDFRPAAAGAAPLVAGLVQGRDGSREARFQLKDGPAGPGTLEIFGFGAERPDLERPLTLLEAAPEPSGLLARLGETGVELRGRHLRGVSALLIGERRYRASGPDGDSVRGFQAEDGRALEGPVGTRLGVTLIPPQGRPIPWNPAILLPARPRIGETQVLPVQKTGGLSLGCSTPLASTLGPSQVNLMAAKGYRFPPDGAFRVALRNAEEPGTPRTLPAARIRVMGHGQKASFSFTPADLLGGRGTGQLEVQVQDEHAGDSDWMPLPATFLDLPVILGVERTGAGFRLTGTSLDQIEAVGPTREGPWEKAGITIQDGREVADFSTPLAGTTCFLQLFGWNELILTVKLPPRPAAPTAGEGAGAS